MKTTQIGLDLAKSVVEVAVSHQPRASMPGIASRGRACAASLPTTPPLRC
jgi:hypothetical protein